jgi:hypothetical protein
MRLNEIAGIVIEQTMRIHQHLGPELLESDCGVVLTRALSKRGLKIER